MRTVSDYLTRLLIAIVAAGFILALTGGCRFVPIQIPVPAASLVETDLEDEKPKSNSWIQEPDLELDYKSMSKWLFLAGIVALFFRHNWGAGCAFAGAILGPVVGKIADALMALSTYLIFAGLLVGFVLAWSVLRKKLNLDDDGTLWDSAKTWWLRRKETTKA